MSEQISYIERALVEEINEKLRCAADSRVNYLQSWDSSISGATETGAYIPGSDSEMPRLRRPLDELFDLVSSFDFVAVVVQILILCIIVINFQSLTQKLFNAA